MAVNSHVPRLDTLAETVNIDPISGLVRIDGIPAFQVLGTDHGFLLRFCDGDRLRAQRRGSRYIDVPLAELIRKLTGAIT